MGHKQPAHPFNLPSLRCGPTLLNMRPPLGCVLIAILAACSHDFGFLAGSPGMVGDSAGDGGVTTPREDSAGADATEDAPAVLPEHTAEQDAPPVHDVPTHTEAGEDVPPTGDRMGAHDAPDGPDLPEVFTVRDGGADNAPTDAPADRPTGDRPVTPDASRDAGPDAMATDTGLDTGPPTDAPRPSPSVVHVAAGGRFSCALVGTEVWCWGANDRGQLGDGTTTTRTRPARVLGLPAITEIASMWQHVCTATAGHEVWCWGANASGQLGDGSTVDRPVPVRSILRAAALSAGAEHTCGVTPPGEAWCLGGNAFHQITSGSETSVPRPVLIGRGALAAGTGADATCLVSAPGTLACSGDGASARPGPMPGRASSVSMGQGHACALTEGEVWCWGWNGSGAVGHGLVDTVVGAGRVEGLTPRS